METSDLRENFNEKLKKVNERINELVAELEQAKEFRAKLLGGLETLQILDPQPMEEAPAEAEESSEG